jgi:beta-galactosidase
MLAISRRQFLMSSMPAAAAAAIPVAPAWLRGMAEMQTPGDGTPAVERLADGWEYLEGSLDGPWQVWNSAEIAVWSKVSLPHCFNHYDACDPDTPAYRGTGWYRRHITVTNPYPNGRTILHFAGAGQTTDVFLGESHLGHHVGGYDEFAVDITSQVQKPGTDLRLAIRCDNGRDLDRMPSDVSDFTLYGGLYRHVSVVYLPEFSLDAIHIHVELNSNRDAAEVTVTGRPNGSAFPSDVLLGVELVATNGQRISEASVAWANAELAKTAFDGERVLARFRLPSPDLWSPSNPHLYQCRVTLSAHGTKHLLTEKFGVRSVEFPEGGPFLLNGERLLLRGTHRHEDHAGYAAALPDEVVRREMRMIRDMGANFIRLAHYQQSRFVLELCDELGLLVWEELPWCRAGVGSDRWQSLGHEKLRTMIDQHFNHPSIIFWGLGNEDDWPGEYPSVDETAIRRYMTELNALAHQLDPSRYTSYRRCDFARDIPDVYSPSIWAGWYGGLYTDYQHSLETQRKRVGRFIHIEWGADSHARRHSEDPNRGIFGVSAGANTAERGLAYQNHGGVARVSRDGDWSETYACDLFDWHLKTQEALPWLAGAAQWIFKDFTTPLRVENPVPRVNQKGLVERDLTPKEAFYVFQSYWSVAPMVRLYGHTWPIRWGAPDEKKMIRVYSNCPEAEVFLNGVSLGIKRRKLEDFPCAGLRWLAAFRKGRNELHVVARARDGSEVTDALNFEYQTEVWSKPAKFELREIARDHERITFRATLHDANGVLCLDAAHPVRFTLAGEGTLIDNLGTSTGSREVQLYNGRAEISIASVHGDVSLAVSSPSLPTALCKISG